MTCHCSALARSYAVDPTERFVCKHCGDRVALARYPFHRCR